MSNIALNSMNKIINQDNNEANHHSDDVFLKKYKSLSPYKVSHPFDKEALINHIFIEEDKLHFLEDNAILENDDLIIIKMLEKTSTLHFSDEEERKTIDSDLIIKIKEYAENLGYNVELLNNEQISKIIDLIRNTLERLLNQSSLEERCPALKLWTADKDEMERKGYLKRVYTTRKGGEQGSRRENAFEFLTRILHEAGIKITPYLHEIRKINPALGASLSVYIQHHPDHTIPIDNENNLIKSGRYIDSKKYI